jgi:RNA recognition motif-containing protein
MPYDNIQKKLKGIAYIDYDCAEAAQAAIARVG